MGETNYNPSFQITPEMQAYRAESYKPTDPYSHDDLAFKQSIVSRAMVGDLPGPMLMSQRQQVFPTRHPTVKNVDGSHSNVVIMGHSESNAGPVYAIPTMVDGRQLTSKEAIAVAKRNGLQNYHQDKTPQEHNAWAKANHGRINEDGSISPQPTAVLSAANQFQQQFFPTNRLSP
jgi:hypothetical protein